MKTSYGFRNLTIYVRVLLGLLLFVSTSVKATTYTYYTYLTNSSGSTVNWSANANCVMQTSTNALGPWSTVTAASISSLVSHGFNTWPISQPNSFDNQTWVRLVITTNVIGTPQQFSFYGNANLSAVYLDVVGSATPVTLSKTICFQNPTAKSVTVSWTINGSVVGTNIFDANESACVTMTNLYSTDVVSYFYAYNGLELQDDGSWAYEGTLVNGASYTNNNSTVTNSLTVTSNQVSLSNYVAGGSFNFGGINDSNAARAFYASSLENQARDSINQAAQLTALQAIAASTGGSSSGSFDTNVSDAITHFRLGDLTNLLTSLNFGVLNDITNRNSVTNSAWSDVLSFALSQQSRLDSFHSYITNLDSSALNAFDDQRSLWNSKRLGAQDVDYEEGLGTLADIMTFTIGSGATLSTIHVNPFDQTEFAEVGSWARNIFIWMVTAFYIGWATDYLFKTIAATAPAGGVAVELPTGLGWKVGMTIFTTIAMASIPSLIIAYIETNIGGSSDLSASPFASAYGPIKAGVAMLNYVCPLKVIITNVFAALAFRQFALYYLRVAEVICRLR